MTAVSIDPGDEAAAAIVARINSATTYTLPQACDYYYQAVDTEDDEIFRLRVDVVLQDQTQLNETLDIEDRSSHFLIIWVRDKLPNIPKEAIAERMLILRKIFQRVNNYNTANGRVKVWDCGYTDTTDPNREENPNKQLLLQNNFFKGFIKLRVEVEAP